VLLQNLRDRRRQRRLAVIHVTNGPDIHVRLAAIEFFFAHLVSSSEIRNSKFKI
jgi:hypothetical protein